MRVGRTLQRTAAALAAVVIAGSAAAPAVAEPPFRVPSQITDQVGVLSGSDRTDVQTALDQLSADANVDLFVVYVGTFDDPSTATDWAAQTAKLSDLGSNQMLLAIATGGRAYAVDVPDGFKISDAQLEQIATTQIQPKLRNDDWAGAAIAAANGYRDALGGGSSSVWWWIAGGIVVVGVGGYLIYRRRRKSDAGTRRPGPGGAAGGPPSEPSEPLDALSARSVQVLIDTDNAVRASEFELNAAEAEFGRDAVAQFRTAFDSARQSLTEAFEIRQKVDDDQPEDDATKRAMMNDIIDRCAEASATLDAQSDRFDDLRDLRSRLPQVLAELPGAIDAQQGRIPPLRRHCSDSDSSSRPRPWRRAMPTSTRPASGCSSPGPASTRHGNRRPGVRRLEPHLRKARCRCRPPPPVNRTQLRLRRRPARPERRPPDRTRRLCWPPVPRRRRSTRPGPCSTRSTGLPRTWPPR